MTVDEEDWAKRRRDSEEKMGQRERGLGRVKTGWRGKSREEKAGQR
jgi:hypothetical protein